MTDKEVEQENIKKRAIVEQAFNDWYINDIKRCFSSLRVCSVYFTDIPHYGESKTLADVRNRHHVQINGTNCVIYSIAYDMGNDNKERIFISYTPTKSAILEQNIFEIGKPTKYLCLLETAVDLLKDFSKNFYPRIIYDYIGD